MDSKHGEDADRLDHNSLGIGRSYECVFCKRGFNTAQALGGHMNIHRKDRARNKPPTSSSSSSSTIFNYSNISNGQIIHPHHFYSHHHQQMNSSYDHHHQHRQQQFMISADPGQHVINPDQPAGFGYEQWSMSLMNMQVEGDNMEKMGRRRGRVGQDDHQELDLELRL